MKIASSVICFIGLLAGSTAFIVPNTQAAPEDNDSQPQIGRDALLESRVDTLIGMPSSDSPAYSADGSALFYVSSRDGRSRLYRHRLSDGTERPVLSSWQPPAPAVTASRNGNPLIFLADSGGDELAQVYTADINGTSAKQVTSTAITRDPPKEAIGLPDALFYSARKPDAAHAVIMRLSLGETSEEARVYEDSGLGFLADVSADGSHALFLRFLSYQSARLVLVDLKDGTAQLRYPMHGEATIRAAAFSREGDRILLTTDGGSEQASVIALDTASGQPLGRFDETTPRTATGEQLVVSPDGKQLAIVFNAGDRQFIRLLDAISLKQAAEVELPLGAGRIGEYSPDGKQLAVTWRTPAHQSSVYLVDTRSGSATRLTSPEIPDAPAPALLTSIETLTSQDGLRFPVIVTRPDTNGRHPVIVDFHGGPAGSASIGWSLSASLANAYDIAYVQPNIRGSGGFGRAFEASDDGARRRDSFKDIDALVDWLRRQPWVDPDRLIVKGSSYGGYLVVQQLAEHPQRWRAGIDQFGIVDLISFMGTTTGLVRKNYLREIGDPQTDHARLVDLSPINKIEAMRTPLFIYAGANDPRVPRAQSDMLASHLQAKGVPVEYMLAPNEGHGAELPSTQRELAVRSMRFILNVLDQPSPGQPLPQH